LSYTKGAAASAAAIGTLGAGLLYYGQNYLIYPSHVMRTSIPAPSRFQMPYEHLTLTAKDGVKIRAFLIMRDADGSVAASSRPTVLMFHGNGGNYGQRLPLAKIFWEGMKCNVILLCYRGYGDSEGSPSERGLQFDSQAVLDYVDAHDVLSKTKVILYGQSLGGAVAIDLASRNPNRIHALILENTFTSLPKLIPFVMPFLSNFTWLCHQKWPSEKRLPLIPSSTPILMISGRRDQVVPPQHMDELWQISKKSGREDGVWADFPFGDHNDTCLSKAYWNYVTAFVEKYT